MKVYAAIYIHLLEGYLHVFLYVNTPCPNFLKFLNTAYDFRTSLLDDFCCNVLTFFGSSFSNAFFELLNLLIGTLCDFILSANDSKQLQNTTIEETAPSFKSRQEFTVK